MGSIHNPLKILSVLTCLSGCTTLVSHTTIEPYTKNKQQRNALESLAENYCKARRGETSHHQPVILPDYIYTTDGCSRWPDGSWQECCIIHDIPYWCGGSRQDRQEADDLLRQCVNDKAPLMGNIMYPGVRIGGIPWLPTPWRWGYGWDNWPTGYEILEPSLSVRQLLETLNARSIIENHLKIQHGASITPN